MTAEQESILAINWDDCVSSSFLMSSKEKDSFVDEDTLKIINRMITIQDTLNSFSSYRLIEERMNMVDYEGSSVKYAVFSKEGLAQLTMGLLSIVTDYADEIKLVNSLIKERQHLESKLFEARVKIVRNVMKYYEKNAVHDLLKENSRLDELVKKQRTKITELAGIIKKQNLELAEGYFS